MGPTRAEKKDGTAYARQLLRPGEYRYAIPSWWYAQWLSYVGMADAAGELSPSWPGDGTPTTGKPPRLDTLPLVVNGDPNHLVADLIEDVDVSFVAKGLHDLLVQTYGITGSPVPRYVM